MAPSTKVTELSTSPGLRKEMEGSIVGSADRFLMHEQCWHACVHVEAVPVHLLEKEKQN